jgi:hypothetical protein
MGRTTGRDKFAGVASLHLVAQFHLDRCGLWWRSPALEPDAAQAGQLTQRAHDVAFRRGLIDFFK